MRYILILLFSALLLYANNTIHPHAKILEKIILEISIEDVVKVWSDNNDILNGLRRQGRLETTIKCEEANIIILDEQKNLTQQCNSKHIFVLHYDLLLKIDTSFGALFWKKGRPNIVIIEPKIKAQSISITKKLEPYLEEKVW